MKKDRLSHARAITNVKDSIHDNIQLSVFDRELVDSPFFQRLHFVFQNSTTYVAFPNNKNSRFSHSLGVAHLCGTMFISALSNSSQRDLRHFITNAEDFIKLKIKEDPVDARRKFIRGWEASISGQSGFRHQPILTQKTIEREAFEWSMFEFPRGFIVDTLWQVLRICGLAHDIGHLPFSHSLEGAADKIKRRITNSSENLFSSIFADIKDDQEFEKVCCLKAHQRVISRFYDSMTDAFGDNYSREYFEKKLESFPIHERRSLYILCELYDSNAFGMQGDLRDYRNLIYRLAFLVLFASMQGEQSFEENESLPSFFRVMKLIVAGSVDADRIDYTIRDGYESGSTIGQFDISKIIENVILYRDRTDERNIFRLAFYYRSVSAIEQFFVQRHHGYKYIIYHRTSSRTEACVQELIAQLIALCALDGNHEISRLCRSFGLVAYEDGCENDGPKSDVRNASSPPKVGIFIYPLHKEHLKNFDDASIRVLLTQVIALIQNDGSSFTTTEARLLAKRISVLASIFLYREFEHIYDPFKIVSMRRFFLKSAGDCSEDGLSSYFNTLVRNETTLADEISRAEAFFEQKLAEKNVSVVISTQPPKVNYHEGARKKGEEVLLAYPALDDTNDVSVRPVIATSTALESMEKIFVNEFKVRIFFVGRNIKSDVNLRREIDEALQEYVAMVSESI